METGKVRDAGTEDYTFNHIRSQLPNQRCFDQNQLSAYFLSPSQFHPIASWVGALRATTYRQISPLGPEQVDLDGRDAHYWHLLILDQERHCLAGCLRMGLSRWHGQEWDGSHSYLGPAEEPTSIARQLIPASISC